VRPVDSNALDATVRFPKLSALPQIIARLRRVFDLAADPDAIALQLVKDPTLAPLVAARPGLRVPGAWDGFELAVRAVLGQQITVPGAIRLAGALVSRLGEKLRDPDGALTHLFPDPAVLTGVDPGVFGHAAKPWGGASGGRCGGGGGSAYLRRGSRAGGSGRATARAAGHRGMDGAIYRDAATAGAGRISGGGYRIDAGDGGLRGVAPDRERVAGTG
jgi:3-methyladenine DNA glycosylase/8-oxoguanine DNA glycosylase